MAGRAKSAWDPPGPDRVGAVRVKAASAARTGAGPGAGKQGTWREDEDSEPKSGPIPAVLATLGQFMPLPNKHDSDNDPGAGAG